jgi:hypothetical protein
MQPVTRLARQHAELRPAHPHPLPTVPARARGGIKKAKRPKRAAREEGSAVTVYEDETATQPLARQQEIYPYRLHALIQECEIAYSLQVLAWAGGIARAIDARLGGRPGGTAFADDLEAQAWAIQARIDSAPREADMLKLWGRKYVTAETVATLRRTLDEMLEAVVEYDIDLGAAGGRQMEELDQAWKVVIAYHTGLRWGVGSRGLDEYSEDTFAGWTRIMQLHLIGDVVAIGEILCQAGKWWVGILEDVMYSHKREWSVDVHSLQMQNWFDGYKFDGDSVDGD